MSNLEKELKDFLEVFLDKPTITLETTETGRVGGTIISHSFSGLTQIDRQNKVWDAIEEKFPVNHLQIISLLTLAPEEMDEYHV